MFAKLKFIGFFLIVMAGLYIHIPFCKRKCGYCDFYSVASTSYADRYVDCLLREYDMRKSEIGNCDVATLYVGGGTPSVLTIEQTGRLFDGLRSRLRFADISEVTMEVNPDDITESYIRNVSKLGVNRISMGVQSFVDSELRSVNRRHNASEAVAAVEMIKGAGIDNLSIDLIYGLPGQTLDTWQYSLDCAVRTGVCHISAYCLSYEEGTALTRLRDMGRIKEADEELCVKMHDMLCERLSVAGYEHYEISNFARNEKYSIHNSNYWNGTPYLGLGAAAHSFDGVVRRYNPCDIKKYVEAIESGMTVCVAEKEEWWQRYNEMIMVGLRTMWGVKIAELVKCYGDEVAERFKQIAGKYVERKKMVKKGEAYVLTEGGVMISDAIIRDLMIVYDND